MALAERFHSRALASSEALTKLRDPATRAQHLVARYFLNGFTTYTDRIPENHLLERQVAEDEDRYHHETNPDGQQRLHQAENLYSVAMHEYQWRRDYAKAEALFKRAMLISEEQVGPSHPTGEIHKRLANLFYDKGEYEAAGRGMFELVRCIYEGKEAPEYATHMAVLGAAYAAATGDLRRTLETLVKMLERWQVQAPILSREILLRHLLGDTNDLAKVRQQFWQDVETRTMPNVAIWMLSVPWPAAETNQLARLVQRSAGDGPNDQLLGMMAYRSGDWTNAVARLGSLIQHPAANYYLAMSYQNLRDSGKAREHLNRANQLFDRSTVRGLLLPGMWEQNFWVDAVAALILRDEAETLILGKPATRDPLLDVLAEKRAAWEPARRKMEEAAWAARKRQYPQAGRHYDDLARMTNFAFSASNDGENIPQRMFTVAWALGDTNRHVNILRQMHTDFATNETQYLPSLAELSGELPPDLEVRRRECRQRKELEDKWTNQNPTVQGDDAHLLGMIWYREGKFAEALKALERITDDLTFVLGTSAKTFAAMANWNLGKQDEARRLLKAADERFNTTVIIPGEGMYQPWFASSIVMEMLIKEADQLIDTNAINAPHVAALPKDGW